MNITFYIILFIFWGLFWSFASVIITRLHSWEKGIIKWRSHCTKCNTQLKITDLIPIISFLSTLWKCRYCKEKMSFIYPILEISTWLLFSLIWFFLIDFTILFIYPTEFIKLIFWLIVAFISILYIFYDILYLEIHEWIMLSWVIISFLWLIINTFAFKILNTINFVEIENIWIVITAIIIAITIIWWLYTIMLKELKSIYDILIIIWSVLLIFIFKNFFQIQNLWDIPIISWIIWALWIFIFFYLQILLSDWKAMWWWDLRIWIMVWLILWVSYSIAWLFFTYLVWSIISIGILLYKKIKIKNKKIDTTVPFWPFIWIWFFITIFFLPQVKNFIEIYFNTM